MAYGIDFRKRVINAIHSGQTKKEACALFGNSTTTLHLWEKELAKETHLERKPPSRSPRKLPLDQLEEVIMEHPDAFLRDSSDHFKCSIPSVWPALKKLEITLKKTTTDKEQDGEKVKRYLDSLACFSETPVA